MVPQPCRLVTYVYLLGLLKAILVKVCVSFTLNG